MSRITYKEHTDNQRTIWGTPVFDFKIVDSITKTHFKALMRIAKRYDSKSKSGHIVEADKDTFLKIVEKADKSSEKVCKASHAKSVEKAKARYSSNRMSGEQLEDILEDVQDERSLRGASRGELITAAREHRYI